MEHSRELSDIEIESINATVRQITETYKILNNTVKPDTFFMRLGFLFDRLLMLKKYEQFGVFTDNNPTKRIKDIQDGLGARVDRFVGRYMEYTYQMVSSLKTQKGRANMYFDLANKLISAFDCANTFWKGSKGFPHYRGPLFTKENYKRVDDIFNEVCDICDPYMDDGL